MREVGRCRWVDVMSLPMERQLLELRMRRQVRGALVCHVMMRELGCVMSHAVSQGDSSVGSENGVVITVLAVVMVW